MVRSWEARQPEWYLLAKAAEWLGCAPWELEELPSFKREFWLRAALVGSNAEQEARELNDKQDQG